MYPFLSFLTGASTVTELNAVVRATVIIAMIMSDSDCLDLRSGEERS